MSNPKRPEDRQRRNLPAVLDASATPERAYPCPVPPAGLSDVLLRSWEGLWSSPVAQLLDPVSDLPAITRLYDLYALRERLQEAVDTPEGLADDKLLASLLRVSSEVRLIEAQLGLSPRSRLALGLALLAGRKAGTLDDAVDDADE